MLVLAGLSIILLSVIRVWYGKVGLGADGISMFGGTLVATGGVMISSGSVSSALVFSTASVIVTLWLCWTRWTPLTLRRFSEHRRLHKYSEPWPPIPDDEVPVSLWQRPGFVARYWPTWL